MRPKRQLVASATVPMTKMQISTIKVNHYYFVILKPYLMINHSYGICTV